MSFFHEPPPLDSDIPPPLEEDKLRDNDFDLEEEEIIEDNLINNCALPELPTDFNVFSSAATDENISFSHPPPELPDLVIPSSPDVGDSECDKSESENFSDVSKEKESDVVMQDDQIPRNDEKLEEISSVANQEKKNTVIGHVEEVLAVSETIDDNLKTFNSAVNSNVNNSYDDNIPSKENRKIDDSLQNSEIILDQESPNDDDFNDFVSNHEIEFKTEPFLENKRELDDTEFKECDKSPESIPELKLDDDDDDFNDFETAIPINRQVDQVPVVPLDEKKATEEVHFEADFSGFNAFNDSFEENNTFDDFQGFKAVGEDGKNKESESQLQNADDDDEFGDFSDFTQASAPVTDQLTSVVEPVAFVKPANVNGILDMMFPPTSTCSEEKHEMVKSEFSREQQVIKSDNFVNKFNDFDSTLALRYLYSNSQASQTLVKALGIDTRNILLGPQWASSSASSNMPRFAANMSFNPIEPMKPQTSLTEQAKPSLLQPVKVKSDTVPEAEFDWNSSGLVNPLDGPQPKPQQPHEPILVQQQPPASSAPSLENESSLYVVDQEVSQVFETETKADASHKSELNNTLSTTAAYQWSNEAQQHHIASSNILVRERTIKLPETHIFTPIKGTSPVAREVVSRDVSPTPDDPYFPAKGSIVVKEYHDVEYSLEPKKKSDPDMDFEEFQSAQPAVAISKLGPILLPLNLLEPQKVERTGTEIKWPQPGTNVQFSNEFDFLETSVISTVPKMNFNLPLPPPPTATSTIAASNTKKKEPDYSKPVIGTSPTERNGDDDDFNDFQAAPAIKLAPKAVQSVDPITLSPARLVAQQSNQKSTWISSMDDDEINRIEAAFPKCKPDKKSTLKSNEEDDWSDFVAAPSMISSNTMEKLSNGDGDDWSDFVSVPPPMINRIPSAKSSGSISSQLQSKPNFSSWNQPLGKHHQFVNHSTSFLTNEPRNQNQQFTSSNYPYVTDKYARDSITITDNFNYNFNHPDIAVGTVGNHNHHQQQQKKPNGISTILPELDFAMPKTLMNLPRSGGGNLDSGKK